MGEPVPKRLRFYKVPRSLATGISDAVGDFLFEVGNIVLYMYSGYSKSMFEEGQYECISTKHCKDEELIRYMRDSIRIARKALRVGELETYEVCIVDSEDKSLIGFSISFRNMTASCEEELLALDPRVGHLRWQLQKPLLDLKNILISHSEKRRLMTTATRPVFSFRRTPGESADNYSSVEERLLPWTDTIFNPFIEVSFAFYMPTITN